MIAVPHYQRNHNYINLDICEWLTLHYGDKSYNGRVFIGHRRNGGGVYTMTARSLSELYQYIMMIHVSKRLDYYITANTVSGTSRTTDGLFGLQNIVIDIDCHEEDVDRAALVQAFLWRAKRDLWSDGSMPCPNSIVRTGRGVQLWWAIKPCHVSCRYYYDRIKTGLMDRLDVMLSEYSELDGLQVDRVASSNPVGYYRLPLTYNTAAKRYSTLQILREERYDTHELAERITPLPHKDKPTSAAPQPVAVAMDRADLAILHNAHTSGSKRVAQLIKLRNLRAAKAEIGAETRNNLCFAVYNALRASCDHEEAMETVEAFNAGFKEPMTAAELEQSLCTARRKGGYKYTNARLIELLGISKAEQDAIGLHPFTGVYRDSWDYAKPNATRDAVRKARRDGRDAKIISLYQDGTSQAETARILGISRNTVARVLRDWQAEQEAVDLLKNGSIYDCLLFEQDVAVSTEDGQPGPSFAVPSYGVRQPVVVGSLARPDPGG